MSAALQDPEVRARMSAARRKKRDYMAARQARVAGDVLGALRRGAARAGRPKIWRLADDR